MLASVLRIVVFVLFKEAYFYAGWLPVTSRCAIRGPLEMVEKAICSLQRHFGLMVSSTDWTTRKL